MKLAEKLAAMSNEQATKEEVVTNEIVNFFAEKFTNGEMMEAFEKKSLERRYLLKKEEPFS